MSFNIVRNDITKVKADAIVNTANPKVDIGGGVDAAIYEAAGKEKMLAARSKIGELMPGEVGVTPGFDLDAKYVIHASGPWWQGGDKHEAEILRKCYDLCLSAAVENGCESIAFPVLATGTYGFPKELGIQIAVDAFTDFLKEHEIEITLVVFTDETVSISGKLVEDVASYIDDDYVAKAVESEYAPRRGRMPEKPEVPRLYRASSAAIESSNDSSTDTPKNMESLEEALKDIYADSFGKHVKQIVNKKGLKNSEVYANACMTKQYFSKILNGQVNPSKERVLALAIGLHLNLDETVDLLKIAGYALSPISQTDKVVEYFIVKKIYNVIKIDMVLFDFGLEPLVDKHCE
ncbi:MAG: macro domain-containing protein [Lachnospiraceae bacterium]|nr:macro domain-containing protein [Lachnospiraceae bacterium]